MNMTLLPDPFWNTIHVGDNLDYIDRISASEVKFDLILTDPPYNIGKDFGNKTDKQESTKFLKWLEERLVWLPGMLNPSGSMICFASHMYVDYVSQMMRKWLKYRRMLIWHYKNGMSRQEKTPVTEYEPFLWFSLDDNFVYNVDDMRVPYRSERVKNPCYKTGKDGVKHAWFPNALGAKRGDIWEVPTLSGKNFEEERTEHPTQKPIQLFIDIIKAFCPKVDGKYVGNVFDPFMGSGTTAICCEILKKQGHNIKWIGIEMEQKWVDKANERLKEVQDGFVF